MRERETERVKRNVQEKSSECFFLAKARRKKQNIEMHNIHLKREMFEIVSKKRSNRAKKGERNKTKQNNNNIKKRKREKKETYRNCYSEWMQTGKKNVNPYRLLLMPIGWMANTAKLCALQTFLRFSSFRNISTKIEWQKNTLTRGRVRSHTRFSERDGEWDAHTLFAFHPNCTLVSLSLFVE